MEKLLTMIASQSPWLATGCLVIGILIPKIFEFMLKKREGTVSERERSLKRLEETANDLYEKLDKLDHELDEWKGKYYQLKNDFNQLEATQFMALQRLKDAGINLQWPQGSEEKAINKHEVWGELLDNCAVGVHLVDKEGRILWANKAEMDLLGYQTSEYLGHPISFFHADADVIEKILSTLTNLDKLTSCPARLKASDGSIVHVLINSSVYVENDEFVHTRCFTTPISEEAYNKVIQA
jgi:PAS domain S-box-containing protein